MSQDIVKQNGALAVKPDQTAWTTEQATALKHLGLEKVTRADTSVFLHVCQKTGLDPFARQIYMIERQGKQTIQTGIDGYRLVARRAATREGSTLSYGAKQWCGPDGQWTDVWLADEPPAAARVVVIRGGGEFPAVALFKEYRQLTRQGELTSMWRERPAGQLMKCAEALALRMAYPQDLAGVYVDEEMHQADNPAPRGAPTITAAAVRARADEAAPAAEVTANSASRACEQCGVHVGEYEAQEDGEDGAIVCRNLCPCCYGEPHADEPCKPIDPSFGDGLNEGSRG